MICNKCYYDLITENVVRDEYETTCGNSILKEDVENICPIYCLYCGDEITLKLKI